MGLAEIWAAIQSVTSDAHDRMTLLYATAAESGARPIHQAGGPAMGYYQIEPGQGVTEAQANDPLAATQLFYNRWPVHACATEQGQLWQTNPDQAATNAAGCAERNAAYLAGAPDGGYSAAQRDTQRSLWAQAQALAIGGPTVNPPAQPAQPLIFGLPGPGSIIGGVAGGAANAALSPLIDLLRGLFGNHTFWIRALLTAGGFVAVLIGVKGLAGIDTQEAVGAAAMAA